MTNITGPIPGRSLARRDRSGERKYCIRCLNGSDLPRASTSGSTTNLLSTTADVDSWGRNSGRSRERVRHRSGRSAEPFRGHGHRCLRSTDGGASWEPFSDGLPGSRCSGWNSTGPKDCSNLHSRPRRYEYDFGARPNRLITTPTERRIFRSGGLWTISGTCSVRPPGSQGSNGEFPETSSPRRL